ncbi:FAD-dependent oxidoreductase [Atopobacter phocae]|uniref:FAD-dependent oxidoreductase n=1 Tax=Atopobacter phocae TaxID=136492 RepID=UPI000470A808|nr:FAD-dependent oxidoreductase [Atopobacter phocae]
MTKEIVIVGAGFSGIAAARKLSKEFKKDQSVNITLIDKKSYHTYMTELHEVAGGRVDRHAIKYDLQRIFARLKNINLVTDEVVNVDREKKQVVAKNGTFNYDYLILGMGGEPNDFGVPGVTTEGFTLWSIEDAEAIHDHVLRMCQEAQNEHDADRRRALLTFVVCGAGFTGVEMIGELYEWTETLAREYKLDLNEFSVILVEAAPQILNMVTEKEREKAMKYMHKVGIQTIIGNGITEVTKDHVVLGDGAILPTYTCIWTAGVRATSDAAHLGLEKARANRLVANEYLQAKGEEDVYVIGDLVYYEEQDKGGSPTPQIVQAAEQTGETAAHNIIASIKGTEKEAYKGKYDGFMVSIGSRYGVAYLMNKYHLSGFITMFMKHMVNLLYFFTIRSGYYMVKYVQHEFFEIKEKRNIFRGHLASHGNRLWLIPLRLYYGSMWLFEGLKKMFGWFGTTSWFGKDVMMPFEWLQDPTSGASEAVQEAGKPIFGLSYAYGEEPMMVFSKMPKWFEAIMKVMMPHQDMALFMQKFMTLVEIGIGLCLIVGLFVWLTSAATVGFVVMFSLSGMFYWANVWFVPVAIALMAGAGRTFGLDYYVMPWIGKRLSQWWYGKTNHIYPTK